MKILKAEIKNYRNIEHIELIPCEGVNIIYGENAQGKTNILESIFPFDEFDKISIFLYNKVTKRGD